MERQVELGLEAGLGALQPGPADRQGLVQHQAAPARRLDGLEQLQDELVALLKGIDQHPLPRTHSQAVPDD
jgi:hypothetical protein